MRLFAAQRALIYHAIRVSLYTREAQFLSFVILYAIVDRANIPFNGSEIPTSQPQVTPTCRYSRNRHFKVPNLLHHAFAAMYAFLAAGLRICLSQNPEGP